MHHGAVLHKVDAGGWRLSHDGTFFASFHFNGLAIRLQHLFTLVTGKSTLS
jgi:hypothetical protein